MALLDYLRLLRLNYSVTFVITILGTLFFASELNFAVVKSLVGLFVSFVILYYGGMYTLNGIFDVKSDQKHPLKKDRPLPSGKVTVNSAKIFSAALIGAGIVTCFLFFGHELLVTYVLFFAINMFYTSFAKKVPYLELAANAASHPLRFLMGVQLVSNQTPYLLLVALFLLYIGLASLRRIVEMDIKGWEARDVLKSYSRQKLWSIQTVSFLATIPLLFLDHSGQKLLYAITLAAEVFLVFGIYYIPPLRALLRTIWTK